MDTVLRFMPGVLVYKNRLRTFDRQWVRITLTGKINSNRVASTLIDFMEGTQSKFLSLQDNLIQTLVAKNCDKVISEMSGLSQVVIDILKRNLFERTADVGFLATDDDIVDFLSCGQEDDASVDRIEDRLRAYRDKYTVYDDIVIFDARGQVRAKLDRTDKVSASSDPLLAQTLETDGYVETFRASDIRPGKGNVLVYSQRIPHPETGLPLGVLCLCFDFAGEMAGIAQKLLQNRQAVICILDKGGTVIATSDAKVAPSGSVQKTELGDRFGYIEAAGATFLAKTARTRGYQGFVGLPWFGHVLCPAEEAFRGRGAATGACEDTRETSLFSGALKKIDDDADDILSDLGLVVLNGEVMAAKQIVNADPVIRQEANALPPVLGAIHQVGENIRGVFAESISSLLGTVMASKRGDLEFLASLAIDIMDRNLYERANDCRWWALHTTFRRALARGVADEAERRRLRDILAYINDLYTVYSNLILFDRNGLVLATSRPSVPELVGTQLGGECVGRCLQLTSPQQYVVSDFERFAAYPAEDGAPRHTYIYNAPVLHPEEGGQAVGGIAIVFDGEPQFRAMLEDALPRDEEGRLEDGCHAFYLDRNKRIVSATGADWRVGEVLPVPDAFVALGRGETRGGIISLDGRRCLAGCAMSDGYREYKRDGIYDNDVAAVMIAVL
jgi:hypothetical protein